MSIKPPKAVAAEITLARGPGLGYYYNGLLCLEDAASRIEPAIAYLDSICREAYLDQLAAELGIAHTRAFGRLQQLPVKR